MFSVILHFYKLQWATKKNLEFLFSEYALTLKN